MVQGGDGDEGGWGVLFLLEWLLTSHCKGLLICMSATRTRTTASSKNIGPNLEIKLEAPVFFTVLLCRHSGAALAEVRLTKVHC